MSAPVLPRPDTDVKLLEGATVSLERLNAGLHVPELWESIGQHDDLWAYIPSGPFASEKEFHDWAVDRAGRDGVHLFAIRDKKSGKAEGLYFLLRVDPAQGFSEIGLTYGPALQRTVAGTEAFYLLANYVLGTLGYRRLEWRCGPDNGASNRAALRYGFTREGLLRQTSWTKGVNWDTVYYSILDREWPAIAARFEAWLSPRNFDADGRQVKKLSDFA